MGARNKADRVMLVMPPPSGKKTHYSHENIMESLALWLSPYTLQLQILHVNTHIIRSSYFIFCALVDNQEIWQHFQNWPLGGVFDLTTPLLFVQSTRTQMLIDQESGDEILFLVTP